MANKDKHINNEKDVKEKLEDQNESIPKNDPNNEISDKDIIKNLNEEIKTLKEKILLEIADKSNSMKMFKNEIDSSRKYGARFLAGDLLPAIGMLKQVVASSSDNPEIKNYLIGFNMIVKQIEDALEKNGISQINVKIGDKFDTKLHEAVEQVEDSKMTSGQIVAITANGYKIYDKVIKHAMVKVAK